MFVLPLFLSRCDLFARYIVWGGFKGFKGLKGHQQESTIFWGSYLTRT